ncbi:MAG: RidA family protein [Acidimicrobiaceae bacterium]|nr:RidA family protein [Acidimicrobiaceae bacterium]MYG99714.1 RidA family protein [Acidimicrobiaceae bacterium]MYL02999.1 RidA family protein [Acidimicrobiaceae bacterium]
MTSRVISPAGIAPPAARYAHAVATDSARQWLHTSGVLPTLSDGSVPDDVGEQARTVWQNVAAILSEAGMSSSDIVSVTTYVVPKQDLGAVMAARDQFMGGHLAASTLVVVPELAQSAWKLEIAVVAAR